MAFDKKDLDKLYTFSIAPLLKKKNIRPRRVDKIQHNEDITKRIIAEINRADFAIADLTYSRPSVYYEGGFAERKIPVIYIVRKDHFKPKPDDEIHKVHFDLRGRNIIPWATPKDKNFKQELTRRVNFVLKPIKTLIIQLEHEEKEKRRYNNLSPIEKLYLCHKYLEKLLKKFRSNINLVPRNTKRRRNGHRWNKRLLYDGKTGFHVLTEVLGKASKKDLQTIGSYYVLEPSLPRLTEDMRDRLKKIPENIIYTFILVCSSKVNFTLLADYIGGFRSSDYKSIKYLYTSAHKANINLPKTKRTIYTASLVIVVDNISCESDLKKKCNDAYELLLHKSKFLKTEKFERVVKV
jgi:nucleoside 2-deoxyribosyltransferase